MGEIAMLPVLFALFLLSGAAGLVYEVAWVRSLSLVFGGSHLAVTTVLAVFMGGLALGSRLLGRRSDRITRTLRFYGALEIGVAIFALAFLGLVRLYPLVYGPLARAEDGNWLWLTTVRVLFAVAAMIVPTTLMGGTLPVLTRFAARRPERLGRHLSLLYGLNTLGAAAGALVAGFFLLKTLGVTATVLVAAATNLLVGLVAISLPEQPAEPACADPSQRSPKELAPPTGDVDERTHRLVLWAAGISGFCALGYEVLWTRMLSLVVGTSTYSFTIILVAFLSGIALGSAALGLVQRRRGLGPARAIAAFAAVQVAIGASALVVTVLMRDLPSHATVLQRLLLGSGGTEFGARQGASFGVSFAYVFVPAFLMGVALPLAGTLHALRRREVGGAVGEVVTWNTVGSVLGSTLAGFVLIYAFGIERSLQMLAAVNVAAGLAVAASRRRTRALTWAVAATAAALLFALAVNPRWGRAWDQKYFAVFRNNVRLDLENAEARKDALENTEVLYYFEGADETISVIRPRGSVQAFIVNGRPEATTSPLDAQCQRTLGHLPMLLHPDPKRVFVLGTGTGMTLGATSLHPSVERIVLAEIEPGVLGAARTFADWNHHVLDDPRLRIVFNDGRNHLATTREKFDVITADPIHPWSGGAAYLYTREYFRSVADHLMPGGIACQWLPLYELSPLDLRTVVRTFGESFPYVMIWLTHYDAELVGSSSPIVLDEAAIQRRITARPEIARDLEAVRMGSAEDFLSYFVAGPAGARAFGQGGVVNTDDNLWLEFSAPKSMGGVIGDNAFVLAQHHESILPYLAPAPDQAGRAAQRARWERNEAAARLYRPAHALYLRGAGGSPQFAQIAAALDRDYPRFAPYRFLRDELERARASEPRLAGAVRFELAATGRGVRTMQVSAVTLRMGDSGTAVMFVDNDRREVYGQRYIDGAGEVLEATVKRFVAATLAALDREYGEAAAEARRRGEPLPPEAATVERLKARVSAQIAAGDPVP